MKRSFRRLRPEALAAFAAVAMAGAGCSTSHDVKAGAPQLIELVVIDNGIPSTITASTTQCKETVVDGADCDSSVDTICRTGGVSADPDAGTDPDGGAADGGATISTPINWCRCPDGRFFPQCPFIPSSPGKWNCGPFGPTTAVIAVFDRLLDTAPFDEADGGTITSAASASTDPAAAMSIALDGEYASNGGSDFDVKPVLSAALGACAPAFGFGSFSYRTDGPSVLLTPAPQLPTGAQVTITLDASTLRAKDGHTGFTAPTDTLLAEPLQFTTATFAASISVPQAPPPDDGGAPVTTVPPDMTPVTVTFTAPVDDGVLAHIFVDGVALSEATTVTAVIDSVTVTIIPADTWPASKTITISVDAGAADKLGETLGAPVTDSFTTGAQ